MAVIRENEIFKRVTDIVEIALDQLGINGFQVMQASQPMATSDHACILVSRIDIHRYGWQGVSYEKVDPKTAPTIWHRTDYGVVGIDSTLPYGYNKNVVENWNYIDEATFQISAFLPRKTTDTTKTVTSYDAVSAIATWVMSPTGVRAMIERGFQPLKVTDVRTPIQQDDSNVPQFNPNFDLRFMIKQQSGIKVPMIEAVGRQVEKMDGRHLF